MKKIILLAALFGLVATLSSQGAEAKENWNTQCAKCHGADGKSGSRWQDEDESVRYRGGNSLVG